MKNKIIGIFICILFIGTVLPVSGKLTRIDNPYFDTLDNKYLIPNDGDYGVKGGYKSRIDILSPDGNEYTCIMFCKNHEKTLEWISEIEELGFEKAWLNNFIELTTFFILPGTVFFFGLNDFREHYIDIFIILRHREEFTVFLNNYDELNGNGIITYLWLKATINRPFDFKSQPDNSWIEDSWILDDTSQYVPNPEIWGELGLWYFEIPS